MYIQLSKKNIHIYGMLLCVFLSYKCMNIVLFSGYGSELKLIGYFLPVLLVVFLYNDFIKMGREYRYLKYFLIYIALSQIVICLYSMYTYNQTIMDMYISMGSYFLLLLSPLLIIGIEKYGCRSILGAFSKYAVIYMILLIGNAMLVNSIGVRILSSSLTSKTNRMRAPAESLFVVLMICVFWLILLYRKNYKYYIIFFLGLVVELYVEQTRMYEIALLVSFLLMWFFQRDNASSRLVKIVTIIVLTIIFISLGLHKELVDAFSMDPTKNANSASTLARINAIQYFATYFKRNPLIGMGWVRPKNDVLTLIFSGPRKSAFFDDLGFLGQIFRQGILGGIIYVTMIIRLLYIIINMPSDSKYRNLIIGILGYLAVSAVSLNCFDGQRILGTSFFIAITEKIFMQVKDSNEINCKEKSRIGKEI